jgi:hypothetical protein
VDGGADDVEGAAAAAGNMSHVVARLEAFAGMCCLSTKMLSFLLPCRQFRVLPATPYESVASGTSGTHLGLGCGMLLGASWCAA